MEVIDGVVVDFGLICQTSSSKERGTVSINATALVAILTESRRREVSYAGVTYPVTVGTAIGG